MTIRVKKDRIEFISNEGTTYSLRETGNGFSFDGVIEGTNIFQDGFQGIVAGFAAGGYSSGAKNTINRYPFVADTNASDLGDLTQGRYASGGQSSSVSGYTSGSSYTNTIDKFPFATIANATDVGDLTVARGSTTGQSSSVSGYTSGGQTPPATASNVIDKFPFATDTNATDVGDLSEARGGGGISSMTSGYTSGGRSRYPGQSPGSALSNTIDKFPFATNANATDVGDITEAVGGPTGVSSSTQGYTAGGYNPGTINVISKFPFATDTNATDVGDLTGVKYGMGPASSTNFGYVAGGFPGPGGQNTIDKFPFSANSNATDVGDLVQPSYFAAGTQN